MAQVFEQNMAEASFGYNLSPHALPKVVGVHPRTLATGEHPRRYLSPAAFERFLLRLTLQVLEGFCQMFRHVDLSPFPALRRLYPTEAQVAVHLDHPRIEVYIGPLQGDGFGVSEFLPILCGKPLSPFTQMVAEIKGEFRVPPDPYLRDS